MSTPAAEPAVTVTGLVKRYGAKTAVDGLSLAAPAARVTAVLGPNGAGKTTTIEACEGYRRPDAGTVRVLGLDPIADRKALRPRVGVMLQSGGVYPTARATEMLRHVASLHAHPLDPGMLIDRLGLAGAGRTPYRRLSGGQQRRLALAMAVVGRPELVFLDEPTAGLDPQARLATWELIDALRADGVTVLLSTHLMDEAERLADHVVIVDHGQVVASGAVTELAGASATETLGFSGPPGLDVLALSAALPEDATVVEVDAGRYQVRGQVTPALLASVTAWCAERGVLAEDLGVRRRTLEDVFLDLTGRELRA
jgi:ABC-2 type transport system ATP-binding protein